MKYEVSLEEQSYIVELNDDGTVTLDGEIIHVDFSRIGQSGLYSLLVNNESFEALAEGQDTDWQVLLKGALYNIKVVDLRRKRLSARAGVMAATADIISPMPGRIIAVEVSEGQSLEPGDRTVILESMKMENELKAPKQGIVKAIRVVPGDSVDQGQVLIEVEPVE